jgi:hypothetical protein
MGFALVDWCGLLYVEQFYLSFACPGDARLKLDMDVLVLFLLGAFILGLNAFHCLRWVGARRRYVPVEFL